MSKPQLTNPTSEQELREQITPLVIEAIKDDLDTWHFMHSVITAHANAEIAKTLERIEAATPDYSKMDSYNRSFLKAMYENTIGKAIQAERAKLKEVK